MTANIINPDGLSIEAELRLAAMKSGDTNDLPFPDATEPGAVDSWRRAQHDAWGEGAVDGEIAHEPATIAGVDCLVAGAEDSPTVMHLHAGGFCLGSPGTDIPITARFARSLRVVSVQYRLAPEHPYPAALDDIEVVYRELANGGPVGVSGISAGGNLAVELAWRMGRHSPTALALLGPHLDFGGGNRPLKPYEAAYLGGRRPTDPLISPSDAPDGWLADLPPLLIQATGSEPMWPSIERFARRSADVGAPVTVEVWQGLWHAWHYHRELPEAHDAVDRAARWLAAQLARRD